MKRTTSILAIIVSYEPKECIVKLYDSIKEQVDEIIIVDNASKSETSKRILRGLEQKVRIIRNETNYGVAKGLNQGAKYALEHKYKWLLTLDQDSEFFPGTYELLLNSFEKLTDKNKIMLIAPKYIEKFDNDKNKIINNSFSLPAVDNVIWENAKFIITSGSLIKTESFGLVGFFEEKLFIDKVDFDFCFKLKTRGYEYKIAYNIFFLHELGHPNQKFLFKIFNLSPDRRYYSSKNAVYIFKKYFFYAPCTTIIMLLRSSILLAPLKILLFENKKLSKIKKIYAGLIDGVLNK